MFNLRGARSASKASFLGLLLSLTAGANALEPATQTDLRAAYCLPYQKQIVAVIEGAQKRTQAMEETLVRARFRHDKLASFLGARIGIWTPEAAKSVLAATEAGKRASELMLTYNQQCHQEVNQTATSAQDAASKFEACHQRLGYEELRLDQCRDVNFLPY
jgi:hypothetical protein